MTSGHATTIEALKICSRLKNWHKLEVFWLSPMKLHLNFFCTLRFNLAYNITNISTHNRIPNIQRKVVQFWGEKENIACNFRLGPLLQKYTISSKVFWICIRTHITFMLQTTYLFLSKNIVEAVWCSNSKWQWCILLLSINKKSSQKGITGLYTQVSTISSAWVHIYHKI